MSDDKKEERSEPTPVTIFGRTYYLRGNGNPKYLAELAAEVDGQMRTIASATGTADTLNIAILAALNLADEFLQARRGGGAAGVDHRLGKLVSLLDEALVG